MTKTDKDLLWVVLGPLVAIALFIWCYVAYTTSMGEARARYIERNPPIPALTEGAPLAFPLNQNKMIEIYERAFFDRNSSLFRTVEERHKYAMDAVYTATSRYNQLMQEIAKHDEN